MKPRDLEASDNIDWTAVKAERLVCPPRTVVFSQGDTATSVMYLKGGRVRLSVLSRTGKEAVIAILESGAFFGESCLGERAKRVATATTVAPASILVITREELIRQRHSSPAFANCFLAHVLKRNQRIERDLIDQLFNNTERRLARTLLLLAQYRGEHGAKSRKVQPVSQEILAAMIGTTRARVNYFMNCFRNLGHIEYKSGGEVTVHQSLLSVLLCHESS
jgi:CRP-like cAMP-binding protein